MEKIFSEDFDKKNNHIITAISEEILTGKFSYVFMGNVGTGKTFMAEHIIKKLKKIYPDKNVKTYNARELYNDYLRIISSNPTDKADAINKRLNALRGDIVLLDDLGTEPITDSGGSQQFFAGIIDNYYIWFKKNFDSALIITTNLNGTMIKDRYGDRILDRFYEIFTICKFRDGSYRRKNIKVIE